MKKFWLLVAVLGLAAVMEAGLVFLDNRGVSLVFEQEGAPTAVVKCSDAEETILPYYDGRTGIYYYFLPSFVKGNAFYLEGKEAENLIIDGAEPGIQGSYGWQEGKTYCIFQGDLSYQVCFMKSENLPAVFLETESGDLGYIRADKANRESGEIRVVQNSGNVEYAGELSKISKRGQVTANVGKIPFSITLEEKKPLCGLESGKKWNFLSLYYEYNKIQSKLIYEMADYLGLAYTSGCEWVDLYCNGEYQGLYLLMEAVDAGDGRVEIYDLEKENEYANPEVDFDTLELVRDDTKAFYNIENPQGSSGEGYLIEKKYLSRLEESSKAHFITDKGTAFEIEAPRHPSKAQVGYISDYVEQAEKLLDAEDDAYRQYIDEDSFARQFLIDMIVLESDAMSESTFFYLDGEGVLKSGPLWDYDRAMGLYGYTDYTLPIEKGPGEMKDWYLTLYRQESFRRKMLEAYKELLPLLQEFVEERIDEYAQRITKSLQMDGQRWAIVNDVSRAVLNDTQITYRNYDSYIKYIKYFLTGRVLHLNEQWEIDFDFPAQEGVFSEAEHTVTIKEKDGSILEVFTVKDGECIGELPPLPAGSEYGWTYYGGWRMYSNMIPVFEDVVLVAR